MREHRQQTVYAGDNDNDQIIVISKDGNTTTLQLDYYPYCGILMKNDTVLAVGCFGGSLILVSVSNPLLPVQTNVIKL